MFLKQAELRNVPDKFCVHDWDNIDRSADRLAVFGSIKDYTPLLDFPKLRHLWVAQTNQRQLDVVRSLHRLENLEIAWLRSIHDLMFLDDLPNLRVLALTISKKDFSVEPVGRLTQLHVLSLAATMSIPANCGAIYCESFSPLADLKHLEYLELFAVRPREGGLEPLTALRNLKEVQIGNEYSLEDYARLSVALPRTKGLFHKPYWSKPGHQYSVCKRCGGTAYTILAGRKQGASICSACDKDKLTAHIAEFERLKRTFVERYR